MVDDEKLEIGGWINGKIRNLKYFEELETLENALFELSAEF